ncbi:glycoside hydrolase family 27 protein [Thermophagus sp. OGC60D27]|uniref:glycoside hydrolase family 27 protein n=1 Tax=Thermophagus sp. OGC60D27 TaxID=3458415 RepID=UPI0040378F97
MQLLKKIGLLLFPVLLVMCKPGDKNRDSISIENHKVLAATPPMGWNSFDAYDCRIDEETYRHTVDFMSENLLEYGWNYAVIDYIWWHPAPGNWDTPRRKGHPNIRYKADGEPLFPEYTYIDEFGRLIPSPERFPSSVDGAGFKALGEYVHSKGLKFGIHIMRGIHRAAWYYDLPIKGTSYTARDIAEPNDTCGWCNHMYGVDYSKPGAQEYYNSLFELYASWGVDFVKADDTMYPPYHEKEIEMIRKAIDNCGRPIVLSLSCGEAPLGMADHLKSNANMWRISGDFWDTWPQLLHNFDLMNQWSSHNGPGHWADADMLPFGKISLDDRPHGPERESRFTWPEHYSLMTLWCIGKSPLMIGSDLLSISDKTLSFFQNSEVLYVNQFSASNRQVYKTNNEAVWVAEDPSNGDKFLALFNLSDKRRDITYDLELTKWRARYQVRDLWEKKDMGIVEGRINSTVDPHGAVLFKLVPK